METVIDAQVVLGYFQETVQEREPSLTGKPSLVIRRLGREDHVFLDDSNQIEHEWRNPVPNEWFDAWYAKLLTEGAAVLVPTQTCTALRKQLWKLGFPRNSRDIWYVRTASAVADFHGAAVILTEDMHFYNPSEKGCPAKRRNKILLSGDGPVATYLCRCLLYTSPSPRDRQRSRMPSSA